MWRRWWARCGGGVGVNEEDGWGSMRRMDGAQ